MVHDEKHVRNRNHSVPEEHREWAREFSRELICREMKFQIIILCAWHLSFFHQLHRQAALGNSKISVYFCKSLAVQLYRNCIFQTGKDLKRSRYSCSKFVYILWDLLLSLLSAFDVLFIKIWEYIYKAKIVLFQAAAKTDQEFCGVAYRAGLLHREDLRCAETSATDWNDERLSQLPYHLAGRYPRLNTINNRLSVHHRPRSNPK